MKRPPTRCRCLPLVVALSIVASRALGMPPPGREGALPPAKPHEPPDLRQMSSDFQRVLALFHEESSRQSASSKVVVKRKIDRPLPPQPAEVATAAGPAKLNALKREQPDLVVHFNKRNGAAVFIKPGTRLAARKVAAASGKLIASDDIGRSCLHGYRDLLRIHDGLTEFTPKRTATDTLGLTHVKYQQVRNGIPVWGREVFVHLDPARAPYLIEGRAEPSPTLDFTPVLTVADAVGIVERDLGKVCNHVTSEMAIHVDGLGIARLVHVVEPLVGRASWRYFVDAHCGEIIEKYQTTRRESVPASGSNLDGWKKDFSVWHDGSDYTMIDMSLAINGSDPNPANGDFGRGATVILDLAHQELDRDAPLHYVAAASPTGPWDPAAVSLLDGLLTTRLYYYETFGRDSVDDNGMTVIGCVHMGKNIAQASWSPSLLTWFFGDGDGADFAQFSGALDVVAHEYTHAVISFSANLEYRYQSGALNEAFADIFACMVDRFDWRIGENCTLKSPGFIRSLVNPREGTESMTWIRAGWGPLPVDMSKYQAISLDVDNGGVHFNMSIPARTAYLLAEGLSEQNLGTSIGREKTEQIYYHALTQHLTRQSNFADARRATIQSAEELYGATSLETKAVAKAWDVVGVTQDHEGGQRGVEVDPLQDVDKLLYIFTGQDGRDYLAQQLPDGTDYYVADRPVWRAKPAIVADGQAVCYVDATNNLRMASLNLGNPFDEAITRDGIVRQICASRDGRYVGFVTTALDNRLYLLDTSDITGKSNKVFELYMPTESDVRSDVVVTADIIEFDLTGTAVLFDCLCAVRIAGAAESYGIWSVGRLEVETGMIRGLIPGQPQGVHVGNPSPGSSRDWLVGLDKRDERTESSSTLVYDLRTGQSGAVAEVEDPCAVFVPSFNGDDTALAITYGGDIISVPLVTSPDGVTSGDVTRSQLLAASAHLPRLYRVGHRDVKPSIQVSTDRVDFGTVDVGQTATQEIVISNAGGYDLTIDSFQLITTKGFTHSGTHMTLAPDASEPLPVSFAPSLKGKWSATLTIVSNDPETPKMKVKLIGAGRKTDADSTSCCGAAAPTLLLGMLLAGRIVIGSRSRRLSRPG